MKNFLRGISAFIIITAAFTQISSAQLLYRWMDEEGVLHYTDDLSKIPNDIKEEIKNDAKNHNKEIKIRKKKRQDSIIIPNMMVFSPPPPPASQPPTLVKESTKDSSPASLYPPPKIKKEPTPIRKSTASPVSVEDPSENIDKDTKEIERTWEEMEQAIRKGNIEKTLTYFAKDSQYLYRTQFTLSQTNLDTYIKEMGKLSVVEIKKNRAEYKILTIRDGVAYNHPLLFIREKDGLWKIKSF